MGGGSGGLPVLDLTATPFPSFSGDSSSEIELTREVIDALRRMHGHGPIIVKYIFGVEPSAGIYFQIILTEMFAASFSTYSGMGTILAEDTLLVAMTIVPEAIDSAYEGKWTATLRRIG